MEQTKEQMYDKLRKEGVIDCSLTKWCVVVWYSNVDWDRTEIYTIWDWLENYFEHTITKEEIEFQVCSMGRDKECYQKFPKFFIENILWHDLSYWRTCRWIENFVRIIPLIKYSKETYLIDKIMWDFSNLRHRKDLPLQEQENEMEILNFLVWL